MHPSPLGSALSIGSPLGTHSVTAAGIAERYAEASGGPWIQQGVPRGLNRIWFKHPADVLPAYLKRKLRAVNY